MNTTENNKLLAEFMNYANSRPITDSLANSLYKDYNSLMQVVEKIESLGYWTEILGGLQNICLIGSVNSSCESFKVIADTKIEAVYNACIEFVKWWNKEQMDSGGKEQLKTKEL